MQNKTRFPARLFMKLGILFNGLITTALAVPVAGSFSRLRGRASVPFLVASATSASSRRQTRLSTFEIPLTAERQDGETACLGAAVERGRSDFASIARNWGCPVRWCAIGCSCAPVTPKNRIRPTGSHARN